MDDPAINVDQLYTDFEWALSQGHLTHELVPLVERLLRGSAPGSPHFLYAKRNLAELIVRSAPFRAARLASELITDDPTDDRALAALGLACLLMGHFKMAERSYRAALGLIPHCPWYAHNLGHLLDVALMRSEEALPLLTLSHRALPDEKEITQSLAHVLYALGRGEEAWICLLEVVDGNHSQGKALLDKWDPNSPKRSVTR